MDDKKELEYQVKALTESRDFWKAKYLKEVELVIYLLGESENKPKVF